MLDIFLANIDAVINYMLLFLLAVHSLTPRLSRKTTVWLLLLYCVVIVTLNSFLTYFGQGFFLTGNYTIALFIPLSLFYFVIVEDSFPRMLFVFFSLFTYTMFVDINTSMLAMAIYRSGNPTIINIIIKSALHSLLFFPVHRYVTIPLNRILSYIDKRHWYIMSIFPMAVCFITLLLSREGFFQVGETQFVIVNAVCIFCFCIYFMVYSLFKKTLDIIELQSDNTLAKSQLLLQREHYRQLSENINNLKRLQHDTRFHYSTIRTLAKSGNSADIIEYLNDILHKQPDYNLRTVCENYAADAIIRHFVILAKSQGISVRISKVSIPEDISIDSYDLSVILGNCLENSIEACARLPETAFKKLELSAMISGAYLVIKVSNTFDGVLNYRQDGMLLSHKQAEGHGLGIRNIKSVVEKYKGNVIIDTKDNIFTVIAALFVQEETSDQEQNTAEDSAANAPSDIEKRS